MGKKSLLDVLNYYKKALSINNNAYYQGKFGQFVNGKQAFDCVCFIKACAWEVPLNVDITKNQYDYIAKNKQYMPDVSIPYFYNNSKVKSTNMKDIPKDRLCFVYINPLQNGHIGLYNPQENCTYEMCGGNIRKVYKSTFNASRWNAWSYSCEYFTDYVIPKSTPTPTSNQTSVIYRVQIGAFNVKQNAINMAKDAKKKGFSAIIKLCSNTYRVQIGAFNSKQNAENMKAQVVKSGYKDAYITTENGTDIPF